MGTIVHQTLIVTVDDWSEEQDYLDQVVTLAKECMGSNYEALVSEPVTIGINGYSTFMIGPTGSKLGWGHHEDSDARRQNFIEKVKDIKSGGYVDIIYIEYGETSPEIIHTS